MNFLMPLGLSVAASRHGITDAWLHLGLTPTQLILTPLSVNCAVDVILPCKEFSESHEDTGPLHDFSDALLMRHESLHLFDVSQLILRPPCSYR
jgi:hypothetical protein